MSQPIFFAHANGFPAGTYRKLFGALAPDYRAIHLDRHGHDPRFPVDDNWQNLVDELIEQLASLDEPVWGVGHSLGGMLHYHTALQHPEFYRGVVMLDSPMPTWLDQAIIWTAKRLGFIDSLTPAGRTLGRREQFASADEAREYFVGKTLFRAFDPDCLEAYIEHGLVASEQGVRLRFDPETEIRIYRSVPHVTPGWPHALKIPLAVVRGRESRVVLPHHAYLARLMAHGEMHTLPGGHMFPLEHPQDTAALLRRLFTRWSELPVGQRGAA
ncbi:alpha/beta fold hydrolase [Stutzerimonas nitrititolerans]|uniref:Alpha/beta hydrolase n=1 Tax=Stutzerimonas nitrititolerans TaxID=2482751 RepID=A0AA41WJN3_9GAMM|nr:alpha/beta hydrolase [Stutzerimonas nitrititolerans]MBA1233775.1 alpha/beta hydrolase [Stutzerimonas stutzeri]MCO7545732.1 alpha/beta hydrolase [Stutzerimonas nitrititolerans]RRV23762.1 alpha/beta hydrolase [Pseudomonas sp. s199]WAD27534.1 alpha/beta hydrolase [Pseudomonadaceae bacterium T75]